jgi:uncharacterized protein YceH (UPF0502 family)
MFGRHAGRENRPREDRTDEQRGAGAGVLDGKSVVTPDLYPLTLNSLTNACNQKTSRDPVLSLDPGVVQHTARALEAKHSSAARELPAASKNTRNACATRHFGVPFTPAEFAVMCLLSGAGGKRRANCGAQRRVYVRGQQRRRHYIAGSDRS